MVKGIILDFDQTIAETNVVKEYRDRRQWDEVRRNMHRIKLIDDFSTLYDFIRRNGIITCIVSRAPYEKYIKYALKALNLSIDYVIGYERGGYKKPSPTPMWLALELMNLRKDEVVAIGDEERDAKAAKSAGIVNITLNINNEFSDYTVKCFSECIGIIKKMKGEPTYVWA